MKENKLYNLTIKNNVIDLKLNTSADHIIEEQEKFFELVEELKEEFSKLFLEHEEVLLVLNDYGEFYILSLVDEFNKNNITILFRNYVEELLTEEQVAMLKNFGVEIIIDYKENKELWKKKILEILELQEKEIEQTTNTSITIRPVFEVFLINIMRELGEENFEELKLDYYLENQEEKEAFVKNIIIEKEKLEKLFPEYFKEKILIK